MEKKTNNKITLFMAILLGIVAVLMVFPAEASAQNDIFILDENLERAIRSEIHQEEGALSQEDLQEITSLRARDAGIKSLEGIQHLINLEKLDLRDNEIADINALAALIHLEDLNLRGNQIRDISPLEGLEGLVELNLRENHIEDIQPLQQLINLKDINLRENQIREIQGLSSLVNLTERLYLNGNEIQDYRPLADLYPHMAEKDFQLKGPAPIFSREAGFYSEPFQLTLSSQYPDALIYYTLDGSIPDPVKNPERTYLYEGPISIRNRGNDPNYLSVIEDVSPNWASPRGTVFKGTVLRAVAQWDDVASDIITKTYYIDPQAGNRYTLPVISITTEEDHLFDYEKGIYVKGKVYDDNFDPEASWTRRESNYHQRGNEWEPPAHIEFFEEDGSLAFSQNIGIRIHGGYTRAWRQKSLRLYARREYDENNIISYEIFPGLTKPQSEEVLDQFKRLILRNSGNDWPFTMMRDAMMQELIKDTSVDTQAYRPAVVFINGEYWGIHNIRERYDHHYLATNYDVETDEVTILYGNGRLDTGEAEDTKHYHDMLDFIRKNDISIPSNYAYIKTQMDIDNFIDYQVAQIYFANTDWPGNNVKYWRVNKEAYDPEAPYGQDGRWRWLLYDTDFGFDLPNANGGSSHNTLAMATMAGGTEWPNPDWSTFLFRSLLENDEFSSQFINRFADQLNTSFASKTVLDKINEIQAALRPEIAEHIHRMGSGWGDLGGSLQSWERNVDVLRGFAEERPQYMRGYIIDHFQLEQEAVVSVSISGRGNLRINTLELSESDTPWRGIYFQGNPITIEAVPKAGSSFVGWEGYDEVSPKITLNPKGEINIVAVFK